MPEFPNTPSELERTVVKGLRNIQRYASSVEKRINPQARAAREELLALSEAIDINPHSQPKTLQLKVGDTKYTSIRRIEGPILFAQESEDEPSVSYQVDPNLIPDGAIGILAITGNIECVNEAIADNYSYAAGWTFNVAIEDGIEYKPQDWQITSCSVVLIKRIGHTFFRLTPGRDNAETTDIIDKKRSITRIAPDKFGHLPLWTETDYYTDVVIQQFREIDQHYAKFWVLIPGSADSEKNKLRQTPRPVHVPVRQPI